MKISKLIKFNKTPYITYCLFILSFLIVSCEKDFVDPISSPQHDSPPQQVQNKMLEVATGEAEVNAVKLKENVKVLDGIMNSQMISYSDAKIEFISHELVDNIQVGDVLNSAPSTLAEYGILARVLDKKVKDGKIILQVEPGEIDDLFDEADFSFSTERGVTLKKGAKKDFSFDLNFGIETSNDKYECSLQVEGKLDFTFDFKLNKVLDRTDNELRTRLNLHFDRNTNNPDLIFALSKTFEETLIDDFKLGVISVPIGGAVIPFTISTTVGAEYKINFGTLLEPVGFDVFGDIGFERSTVGGHVINTGNTQHQNWNTLDYKFVLDLDKGSGNFSSEFKPFKVKLNVTPFKKVGDFFDVTPLSVFGEAYVGGKLGYSSSTSCITFKDIYLGIEGGIEGNFKSLNYEVTVAPNDVELGGIVANLWCFGSNSGTAYMSSNLSISRLTENMIVASEPIYTITTSSGLDLAKDLHGKEVVFKSMNGRDSNTEDHNLLYSTRLEDEAGTYFTMKQAPDSDYYNTNYKVLGTSSYATNKAVFKLFATDNGRYLIKGSNGKFADLHVGSGNPDSHQKFIEFNRTYNEAKTKDDCKFQILLHPHKPGHYYIYKMNKGYLTPKINNPARLKLVTRSKEQEFIMMGIDEVDIVEDLESEIFDVSFQSVTDSDWLVSESYGNGYAYCNRDNIGAWEKFDIMMAADHTFAIRAQANGKYATVIKTDGDRIKFTQTDRFNSNSRFRFVDHPSGNGYKAIQLVKTGKYLTCKGSYDNSPLEANRSSMAAWERWRVKMPEL